MLEYLAIEGGSSLKGSVQVAGAKNSALPLLIATLLSSEECELTNVPDLEDITVVLRLLNSLGARYQHQGDKVNICTPSIEQTVARYGLVKALRASFLVFGPLVARAGQARVSLPGGDSIGSRPVDLHLRGLTKLGFDIRIEHGEVIGNRTSRLTPANIELDYPSVGATEHLLLTCALVPGVSEIRNAAREPEVVELAELLGRMGASVEGAGESRIIIRGCDELGGARTQVLGDRVEAATYLLAAAITQGEIRVNGISAESLQSTLQILQEAGCDVSTQGLETSLKSTGRLQAVSFDTSPFPGVATDVQPLLMAAMTSANGTSCIRETVFDNRFGHVGEYRRFGADIDLQGHTARINGVSRLSGAPVEAGDIRAGAGLVLMGLMADGKTTVGKIHHLERGYESLVEKMKSLGANIYKMPGFEARDLILGC